jgi:hypothetical protein
MVATAGCEAAMRSQSLKSNLSSDRGLKPDLVKPESLVIANQPCRDEYVPGSCTHRPSTQASWKYLKTRFFWDKVGPARGRKSKQGTGRGICSWKKNKFKLVDEFGELKFPSQVL